jgi:hypothetical protein
MIRPSWTMFCTLLCLLYHIGNFLLPTTDYGPGAGTTTVYFPHFLRRRDASGKALPHLDLDDLNLSIRRLKSSTCLREIGDSIRVCFGQVPDWIFIENKAQITLFLKSDVFVAAGMTPANQEAAQWAVQSIGDLNAKLKKEHWKLLVVPVPPKVSICRDSIRWPLSALDKLSRDPVVRDGTDQVCDLLFSGLQNAGVDFIDLRPEFRRETESDPKHSAIFPAAESHWRGRGIEIAADRVTTKLHALYGLPTDRENVKMQTVTYYCDLARAMELSPMVPTPLSPILQIKDTVPFDYKVLKGPPRSLLALAGTSYSGQYSWLPNAGFAATLDAMLPSTRVMSFAEAGHGSLRTMMTFIAKRSEIYTHLAAYPDHLITPYDKYLIWEFPIRDLGAFVGTVFPFSPQNDLAPDEGDPISVQSKNGLEMMDGKSFFWVDNEPATITLRAENRRRLLLLSWINYRGPHLADESKATLEFSIDGHQLIHPITDAGPDAETISVPAQIEQIALRCVNPATVDPFISNYAGRRILSTGVFNLKAKFLDQPHQ